METKKKGNECLKLYISIVLYKYSTLNLMNRVLQVSARPERLCDLIGQEKIISELENIKVINFY